MSVKRIFVRIERTVVFEVEIAPEKLGLLGDAIDLLNKGVCDDKFPTALTEAEIVEMLGLTGEEQFDTQNFSVTRGYLAPFTLPVVPEE